MPDLTDLTAEDLHDGWIIEANDAAHGEPDNWRPGWETWFIEDNEEADRIEKKYAMRGESWPMKPRPFEEVLELFKKVRPLSDPRHDWRDYRFKNLQSGMIIHAWLLK
jgi:hypothetical protein